MAWTSRDNQISIVLVVLGVTLLALYVEQGILVPIGESRRPVEEVQYWEEHVERTPDYPASHLRLGLAYQHVGRADDALREFELALELDPDWEGAAIAIYGAQTNAGRRKPALVGLERFTSEHPQCAPCWQNLAAEYLRLGRLDDAGAAAEALLESRLLDTTGMYGRTDLKLEAFLMAGRVFLARGEHERATALARRASRREPGDLGSHLLEARCLLASGDIDGSLAALDRAERAAAPDDVNSRRQIEVLRHEAEQGRRS